MSINKYISQLEATINSCSIIASYGLNIDRKSDEIVFVSGRIDFRDGTTLDFKEFIEDAGKGIEKYKYAYNYRKESDFLFRYDNAPDPRTKAIKSFPHHKHLEDGDIIESEKKEMSDILNEIEKIYIAKDAEDEDK